MDKKKLEYFRKRLETRQKELRHMVTRNQQDGRSADDEATQDIADRAASCSRWWTALSRVSAKAASVNAFPAEKKSTPNAWKLSPGLATASSARKKQSRACSKQLTECGAD